MTKDAVDVVVLTKNSERVLEECLNSIYKNVPVNRLIIVDGYSTDSTLEIAERFREKYGNVVIKMDNGTRGSARMRGIGEVKTEWFVFVDSDVILCDRWYERAKKFVGDDVGAVWGIEIWEGIQNPATLKIFLKITKKIFELRGGTHDLLVRRKALEGITIPKNLHLFEDMFIKDWIQRRGYKIVATYNPYCMHCRPQEAWTIKGSIGILAENIRFSPLRKLPKLIIAYGFYTAYVVYRSLSRIGHNVMDGK
ncbi:MAG: glycosyltransferase family A protein [Candidatus Bathyarchaeia archaeon]